MRSFVLFLVFALALSAQTMRLSVGQLRSFLRSSIQLKHDDRQVANYLKKVQLTEVFSERDYAEIVAEGLGPKAAEQLKALQTASASLPKPATDPVKPPAPTLPAPPEAQQNKIIEEAREVALGYAKSLPDFICLQVTRRYFDPSGLEYFQLADTVATRLSYFEQKEDYKVVSVNGALSNVKYDQLGGATSSGEFGTLLKEIFEPGTAATFHWERWAKLRGRIAHVYTYEVAQPRSKWHISWQRQLDIVPGYRGLIYVDREVPVVLRVTLEAIGVPASFPIQEARTMLDYDYTDISGREFLLPMRAEMRMREGKLLVKNLVEFRNYRKFGADTSITFDTPEPLPDEKTTEKPPNQ
jgi:hypothetical protein